MAIVITEHLNMNSKRKATADGTNLQVEHDPTSSRTRSEDPSAAAPTKKYRTGGKHRRQTSIYDAVAGRVQATGFVTPQSFGRVREYLDTEGNPRPLTAFEALFNDVRAKNSTCDDDPRYSMDTGEQEDLYNWQRHLPDDLELPDGELLEAIHAYTSDFYAAHDDAIDTMRRNMDSTALLALGILCEEIAREQLGENGDLALLEAEIESQRLSRRWFNGVRSVPLYMETDSEKQSADRRPA